MNKRGKGPLVLVVSCALVFALVSPLRGMWAAKGELAALEQEERVLERRIAALSKERDLLLTDLEVERRARAELGMVRPGEVAVVIPRDADPVRLPAVAAPPERGQPEGGEPFVSRWWNAARRAVGPVL